MKPIVLRFGYILLRLLEMFGSLASRGFNALFLLGSTHQTTSARMHVESWPKGKAFINWFFCNRFYCIPGQKDHCKWAWEMEVTEAVKTLKRAKVLHASSE